MNGGLFYMQIRTYDLMNTDLVMSEVILYTEQKKAISKREVR